MTAVAAALMALCCSGMASYQVYMIVNTKHGDLKNAASTLFDKRLISVSSVSLGAVQAGASKPGTMRSNLMRQSLTVVKPVDWSSPKLGDISSAGDMMPRVEVSLFTTQQGKPVLCRKVVLINAMISSIHKSMVRGSSPATETITFTYQQIEKTSLPGKDGNTDGWKVG